MRKLLLTTLASVLAVSSLTAGTVTLDTKDQPSRLCKVFQEKAKAYKMNMRDDKYAAATLASYEKRAKVFCTKK